MPMTNDMCFVLCRTRYIPASTPALPPNMATRNKVFSGMRQACLIALLLSDHIHSRPIRFRTEKYRISKSVIRAPFRLTFAATVTRGVFVRILHKNPGFRCCVANNTSAILYDMDYFVNSPCEAVAFMLYLSGSLAYLVPVCRVWQRTERYVRQKR